ncbi:MAG: CPBP family intramembrane glutamic endopeptidase [Clostridium sp.]|uniref:CPBP family intramembrane glutamic endopeptidase n=2 Tax=Clostridium sp. TaxID=1506 RepID=UPI002FCB6079
MRKIKGWLLDFDDFNVKPIGVLGGIGFSFLFYTALLIMMLISIAVIMSKVTIFYEVDFIMSIAIASTEVLAYCAVISFIKRLYLDKNSINIEKQYITHVELDRSDYLKLVLISVGEIIFVIGIVYFINLIPIPEFIREFIEVEEESGSFIAIFLTAGLVAPIVEEILFRGILLKGLLKKYSVNKAIVIGGSLFALAHLPDIQNVLAILAGSLIYCVVYAYTRSIIPTIILHMSYNIGIVLSEQYFTAFNIDYSEIAIIPSIILSLIGIIIMFICYKGIKFKERLEDKKCSVARDNITMENFN